MKKTYKIAVSYSHKDIKIAEILKSELKNIFEDRFFLDSHKPEELADAGKFKDKLQNIFRTTDYTLVLYSKNYKEGTFTNVEWEAILHRAKQEINPHLFIINVNDFELPDNAVKDDYTYMSLEVLESGTGRWTIDSEVHERIHDIIHNGVKKSMIRRSIAKKKTAGEYSLNIQTTFAPGNEAEWKMDYDWNLLGAAYVNGRIIKDGLTWQDLWKYVEKDFLYLKSELKKEKDIKLKILFNCQLSIAYKLGQVYGDLGRASGNRNLILTSSNRVKNNSFLLNHEAVYEPVEDFCNERKGNNDESVDIVCIISIKLNASERIVETVQSFLEEQRQEYCKICLFIKNDVISDSITLESMAEYLRERIDMCRIGSKCRVHLFPDTTVPLMFTLGARTIVPGEIQMYEYLPEKDSYERSLVK